MVSVVIPTYNSAATIERCLSSVMSQSYGNLEIICVDDGSRDDTVDTIGRICPQVRVFSKPNGGAASARNMGLAHVTGKYVALLDSDDRWQPQFLARCRDFLERHPHAIGVSTGFYAQHWRKGFVAPLAGNELLHEGVIEDFFGVWSRTSHIRTGSALMRADVVKDAGGQREDLPLCEDLEYWCWLATFGPWGFVPDALFITHSLRRSRLSALKMHADRSHAMGSLTPAGWARRIEAKLGASNEGLQRVQAMIAGILVYYLIQGGRFVRAREIIAPHLQHIRPPLGPLYQKAHAAGALAWNALCASLLAREIAKAMVAPLFRPFARPAP